MENQIPLQLILMYAGLGVGLIGILAVLISNYSRMKEAEKIEVEPETHPLVGRDIELNFGKRHLGKITRAFLQSEHDMIMVDKNGDPYPDDSVIFWAVFPAQFDEDEGRCHSRGLNRKNFDLV